MTLFQLILSIMNLLFFQIIVNNTHYTLLHIHCYVGICVFCYSGQQLNVPNLHIDPKIAIEVSCNNLGFCAFNFRG